MGSKPPEKIRDKKRKNPFRPGAGEIPPHRAGHEAAISELTERVGRIVGGRPGGMVVLYGPRGNGKTTLLEEVREKATDLGAKVRWLEPSEWEGTVEDFVKALPEGVVDEGEDGQKVNIEVNLGFLKVGIGQKLEAPHRLVAKALRVLAEAFPLVLLVDEAHRLPPPVARVLLNAVQRCVTSRLSIMLVLAGTPEIEANLSQAHASFWERSHTLRIGRLESQDDIRAALSLPAERQGLPFAPEALELLVKESQGYPFFIQLLGARAWDAAIRRDPGAEGITLEDAQLGVSMAGEGRNALYRNRLEEISDRNLESEALAVSKAFVAPDAGDALSRVKLGVVLKPVLTGGRTVDNAVKELFAVGLIWQTDNPSLWEPGIPSLCAHITEHLVID